MLVIGTEEVRRLLPMGDCIALMAHVLSGLARGEGIQPLRTVMHLPDGVGSLYTMPAFTPSPPALAVKMVTLFPGNRDHNLHTHQGLLVLFSAETGEPLAVLDAAAVTAVRTAAVSGLATRLLAREDAGDLAIIGSGVQARTHLEAMAAVRTLRRVRAWSPSRERLRAFVAESAAATGLAVEAATSARNAVADADLICVATSARTPVLRGEWVADGAHVNAIGASTRQARELDTALVARSLFYVDRRESAAAEAGDYLIPCAEGAIDERHIRGELGELVTGEASGRGSSSDVTVFKALGIAVEDAAAAHLVHTRAVQVGAGVVV